MPSGSSPKKENKTHEAAAARVRRIANVMDTRFALPGTKHSFGWDAIIGLIPGGDLLTAIPGLIILFEARRLKMPKRILLGMAANLIIDAAVGLIPVLGDIFDFAFKSNHRNAILFEKGLSQISEEE